MHTCVCVFVFHYALYDYVYYCFLFVYMSYIYIYYEFVCGNLSVATFSLISHVVMYFQSMKLLSSLLLLLLVSL